MEKVGASTSRFDLDVPLNRIKRCMGKHVIFDKLPETDKEFEYIMNNIKHQAACVRYKFRNMIKWKHIMTTPSAKTKEEEIFCENMKRWFLTFEPMNVFHEFKSDAGLALFQDCVDDKDLALSSITNMKKNITQRAEKEPRKLMYPIPIKKAVKPTSIIGKHSKPSVELTMSMVKKACRGFQRVNGNSNVPALPGVAKRPCSTPSTPPPFKKVAQDEFDSHSSQPSVPSTPEERARVILHNASL